jgi:hypothetical protein
MTEQHSNFSNFPRLITNQPVTYVAKNEYRIIFTKKPHSILRADIYIFLIIESQLKSQISHIVQRITKECHSLNIRSEHALNAVIHISPLFPQFSTLLKEIVSDLIQNYPKYYWSSSSNGIYCTPKSEEFVKEPYCFPSEVYKY